MRFSFPKTTYVDKRRMDAQYKLKELKIFESYTEDQWYTELKMNISNEA